MDYLMLGCKLVYKDQKKVELYAMVLYYYHTKDRLLILVPVLLKPISNIQGVDAITNWLPVPPIICDERGSSYLTDKL